MNTITDVIVRTLNGGVQTLVFFSNGYGASVIQTPFSYGGDEGLFEIAVIAGVRDKWSICYDTPITNDVLGYLSDEEVEDALNKIREL